MREVTVVNQHPEPAGARDGLAPTEPGARVLGSDAQLGLPQQERPRECE